jgi:hypothetical protein
MLVDLDHADRAEPGPRLFPSSSQAQLVEEYLAGDLLLDELVSRAARLRTRPGA